LWRAVRIIAIADAVMSLDNVIAIAAVADGSVILIAFGLIVSIPLIVAGSAVLMRIMERYPALIWAGAGLLGWVAGEIFAEDPAMAQMVGAEMAASLKPIAGGVGVALVLAIGWLARRRQAKAADAG
jgi:predicted tellurium resistance membrane protein TerC